MSFFSHDSVFVYLYRILFIYLTFFIITIIFSWGTHYENSAFVLL